MLPISIAGSLSLDRSSDISQESLQGITYRFAGTAFINTFCIASFYYSHIFYFLSDTLNNFADILQVFIVILA